MKKIFLLLLFLLPALVFAQNTVTLPGGTSPGTPSWRTIGTLTDSLNKRYFMIFTGGAYNEIYTATYINAHFSRSGGGAFIPLNFSDTVKVTQNGFPLILYQTGASSGLEVHSKGTGDQRATIKFHSDKGSPSSAEIGFNTGGSSPTIGWSYRDITRDSTGIFNVISIEPVTDYFTHNTAVIFKNVPNSTSPDSGAAFRGDTLVRVPLGGGSNTLYTANDSIRGGNRTVTQHKHNILFAGSDGVGNSGFLSLGYNGFESIIQSSTFAGFQGIIAGGISLGVEDVSTGNARKFSLDSAQWDFQDDIGSLPVKYHANYRSNMTDSLDIPDIGKVGQMIAAGGGGSPSITLTGGITGSGTSPIVTTLATVNSNVGSFGDATHVAGLTVNAKGLITAVSNTAITFPVTASNTVTFTNKSGNISQWTNDSGYITSAPTAANPTASVGGSPVNGSATTFMRSDAAPKADTTALRAVTNSYSLSAMQTKLNNYVLTSSLPVAGNPSGLLTYTAANGSASTYERTDGLHAIDSTVVRSVANSRTLAQEQTALNLKANIASPSFTGTITAASLTGYIKGASGILSGVSSIPYSDITGGPSAFTPGRGILIPSTAIILDTTQNYNWLKAQTITKNSLVTTSTDGFILQNTTVTVSGTPNQYSPRERFSTHVWNTTATAADNQFDFINELRPTSGATPSAKLWWSKRLSTAGTGGYTDLMYLDDAGNLVTIGTLQGGSLNITPGSITGIGINASSFFLGPGIGVNSNNTVFNIGQSRTFSTAGTAIAFNMGTASNSSGIYKYVDMSQTLNQSSAAAYTILGGTVTETGTGSGAKNIMDWVVGSTHVFTVDHLGNVISNATVQLHGYTVSTLPTGVTGMTAYVTDALTPSFGTILVGGGAIVTKAFYNGTNWIAE